LTTNSSCPTFINQVIVVKRPVLYFFFKLTLALSISYITLYSVDYHTFLLTNFSPIIWQQIVLVPLLLIKLLSSKNHCSNYG